MDEVGLVTAYVSLGFSILAAGTMIGGTVYYFVSSLREPQRQGRQPTAAFALPSWDQFWERYDQLLKNWNV